MHLEQLRRFCLALPGTHEDLKWGADVCFCVGGKMYAVTGLEGPAICVKVEPPMFDALVGARSIISAPYVGRYHWILVQEPGAVPRAELEDLVRGSYQLVAAGLPSKARAQLGRESASPRKPSPPRKSSPARQAKGAKPRKRAAARRSRAR